MKEQKTKSIYNLKFPVKIALRNEEEPLHWHNDLEILCILKGRVNLQVNNAYYELSEDDIFLINSEDLHRICTLEEKSVYIFVNINISYFEKFFRDLEFIVFIDDASINQPVNEVLQKEVRWRISQMLTEVKNKNVDYQNRIIYHASSLLAALIDSYNMVKKNTHSFRSKEQLSRIWKAYEYMYNNCYRRLDLKEVADYVHVSNSYLSHTMKDAMGLSFERMLNQIRAERAMKSLLTSDESLTKISKESGFSDPKYFKNYFQQFFHCSPEEYRESNQHKIADGEFEVVSFFDTLVFNDLLLTKITQYEDNPASENDESVVDITVDYSSAVSGDVIDKYWLDQVVISVSDLGDFLKQKNALGLLKEEIGFSSVLMEDIMEGSLVEILSDRTLKINWRDLDLIMDMILEMGMNPRISIRPGQFDKSVFHDFSQKVLLHYKLKYGNDSIRDLFLYQEEGVEYYDPEDKSGITLIHELLLNKRKISNRLEELIDEMGLKSNLYFAYLFLNELEAQIVETGENYVVSKGENRLAILAYNDRECGKKAKEDAINILNLRGKRYLLRQFSLYSQQERRESYIKKMTENDFISSEDVRSINRGRYPDLCLEFIQHLESIHRSLTLPVNRAELFIVERVM